MSVFEVSVSNVEGLDGNTILSVRSGSARRLISVADAMQKPLRFPHEKNSCNTMNIKFEALSKLGSAWLIPRSGVASYTLPLDTGSVKGMRQKSIDVRVNGLDEEVPTTNREDSFDNIKKCISAAAAKDYLQGHNVLEFLQGLLHALMRERPADPYAFMAGQLPSAKGELEQLRESDKQLREEVKELQTKLEHAHHELHISRWKGSSLEARIVDLKHKADQQQVQGEVSIVHRKSFGGFGGKKEVQRRTTLSEMLRKMPTIEQLLLGGDKILEVPQEDTDHISFTRRGQNEFDDKNVEHALTAFWKRQNADEHDPNDEFRVLRQNVFTGRWTLYTAGGKFKKPRQYSEVRLSARAHEQPEKESRCPFCRDNEKKTPDPLLFIGADGILHENDGLELPADWRVRVVPNIFPLLVTPPGAYGDAFREKLKTIPHSSVAAGKHQNEKVKVCHHSSGKMGHEDCDMYQVDAVGYSEVVIEDHKHNGLLGIQDPEQVILAWKALQARGRTLRTKPGVRQLLYFKQYGALSGGSLVHPHMQILTLPLSTPEHVGRISKACEYYKEFRCCSVCECLVQHPKGDGPASTRLLYESEHFVAVVPYASRQYRVSIVPKRHGYSWLEIGNEEVEDLARVLQLVMEAMYYTLDDPEYNLYLFSSDKEEDMGDVVTLKAVHWLLDVHPRFPADLGGMELASGIRVISGLPEDMAKELREGIQARLKLRGM